MEMNRPHAQNPQYHMLWVRSILRTYSFLASSPPDREAPRLLNDQGSTVRDTFVRDTGKTDELVDCSGVADGLNHTLRLTVFVLACMLADFPGMVGVVPDLMTISYIYLISYIFKFILYYTYLLITLL
ncbi:hypothetical protein FPSE_12209 [Fusarium pseudograminearum CS3096]|uniref:Uncharacterized protein n=1 Tax=Fusarium pseudograminearum (strain CS3096) TaxID=1028729 RepID=K3V765_FUSPC|nr:hypothetical protein FPSE_12209 [Fusarium pseudograminearum CS3096]EKJ67628.1 hypothetical protein FPSE_12209 [Fusarium pseudograminearum CS3096]